MSLNKSVADASGTSPTSPTNPDYAGLIRFLVQPFLEHPNALKIDCEASTARSRVWVRLAFESADKGRVFGRGGRNIQAIRTVLEAVAQAAGQTAHLDVYGGQETERESGGERAGGERAGGERNSSSERSKPSRAPSSKAPPKLRPHDE